MLALLIPAEVRRSFIMFLGIEGNFQWLYKVKNNEKSGVK
jgi:hypothetical protein